MRLMLNNIKIGSRLIAGFLAVAVLTAIVGIFGFYGIVQTAEKFNKVIMEDFQDIQYLENLNEIYHGQVENALKYISEIAPQEDSKGKFLGSVDNLMAICDMYTEYCEESNDRQKILDTLGGAMVSYDDFVKSANRLFIAYEGGTGIADMQEELTDFDEKSIIFENSINKLMLLSYQRVSESHRQAIDIEILLMLLIVAVSIFAVALAVILGFFIYRSISIPIKSLSRTAKLITGGDLSKLAEIYSKDEVGELARLFNEMVKSLIGAENYAEILIHSIPISLLTLNPDTTIRSVNLATCNILGYEKKELIDEPIEKVFGVSMDPSLFTGCELGESTGGLRTQERKMVYLTKTGGKIPVLVSISISCDEDGGAQYFIVTAKDIREIEKYIEERLSFVIPILQKVSLGDFSKEIVIPGAEDEFTELLVAINLMIDDLRLVTQKNMDLIDALKKEKMSLGIKVKERTMELATSLVEVGQERDKTRAILYGIGDGVFVVDRDYKITILNRAASAISGFTEEEAIGKEYGKILQFVYEESGKINDKFIKDAMMTGKIGKMFNHTLLIRKDGEKVSVSSNVALLKDGNGNVVGCIVVFQDSTKAREIDKMKTEFVSMASHQLKTPLTAIKWFMEILTEDGTAKFTDRQKEYFGDIYKSTRRMIRLVDDLLNISRLETGVLAVKPVPVQFEDIVRDVINDIHPLVDEKYGKIVVDMPKEKLPTILLDESLIEQVVRNLIGNAIHYSEPGKCEVRVKLEKGGGNYVLSISDKGIGVSREAQKKLFDKFFRAGNAQKMDPEGTGLGLYISKMILESSGGKIWLESEEGKGSTFYVSIPIGGMKEKEGEKKLIGKRVA